MTERIVTLRQALYDKAYFGKQLAGDSWANWRAVLLAMANEPLEPNEQAIVCNLSGRQSLPKGAPREFWAAVGRRSGKSRACACYAAWLACCHDHRSVLAPGERGQLMVLSPTRDQSQNLFRLVQGAIASAPALCKLVENTTRAKSISSSGQPAIAALADRLASPLCLMKSHFSAPTTARSRTLKFSGPLGQV